jgi:hypothetical protein
MFLRLYNRFTGIMINPGTKLAEVQLLGAPPLKWTEEYNGPGTLTATILLSDWLTSGATVTDVGVHLCEDAGAILWTGLVWTVDLNKTQGTCVVNASGWLSVLRRQMIRADLNFVNVDQLTIAGELVAEAQSHGFGGGANYRALGINGGVGGLSGVLRTRNYKASEYKSAGVALEQLAAVQNGFQFRICDDNGVGWPAFRRGIIYSYPATTVTTTVFRDGSNVDIPACKIDGTGVVGWVDFLAGPNRTPYTSASGGIGPMFDEVLAATDITEASTANAIIARRLADGVPIFLPTVIVRPDSDTVYDVGHVVRVISETFGVNQLMRIDTITRTGNGSGYTSAVTLSRVL